MQKASKTRQNFWFPKNPAQPKASGDAQASGRRRGLTESAASYALAAIACSTAANAASARAASGPPTRVTSGKRQVAEGPRQVGKEGTRFGVGQAPIYCH